MDILKSLHSKRGVTLLEVMVAVAITSLALVSLVSLVLTSLNMEEHSRKVTDATLLADGWINAIERTGLPEIGVTEGPVNENDPKGFHFKQVVTETPIEQVRHISVEILWNENRDSVSLEMYMVRK